MFDLRTHAKGTPGSGHRSAFTIDDTQEPRPLYLCLGDPSGEACPTKLETHLADGGGESQGLVDGMYLVDSDSDSDCSSDSEQWEFEDR